MIFLVGAVPVKFLFWAIHAFLLALVTDSDAFLELVGGKPKEWVEKWIWIWVSIRPATSR